MAKARAFTILIATDGSDLGTAAVDAAVTFPWPAAVRARGLVVRSHVITSEVPEFVLADIERSLAGVAADAKKILARRWSCAARRAR